MIKRKDRQIQADRQTDREIMGEGEIAVNMKTMGLKDEVWPKYRFEII